MAGKVAVVSCFVAVFSIHAFAEGAGGSGDSMFAFRAHYGMWTGAPKSFNSELQQQMANWPATKGPSVLGADFLVTPKDMPVIFGVRYENFTSKATGSSSTTISGQPVDENFSSKLTGSRVSGLVGYESHFDSGFVGVLGGIGLMQKMEYDYSATFSGGGLSVTGTDALTGNASTSFNVGVEAGVKAQGFEFGIEAGYISFKGSKFTVGSTGKAATYNDGSNVSIDLSGPYVHGFLGYAF